MFIANVTHWYQHEVYDSVEGYAQRWQRRTLVCFVRNVMTNAEGSARRFKVEGHLPSSSRVRSCAQSDLCRGSAEQSGVPRRHVFHGGIPGPFDETHVRSRTTAPGNHIPEAEMNYWKWQGRGGKHRRKIGVRSVHETGEQQFQ